MFTRSIYKCEIIVYHLTIIIFGTNKLYLAKLYSAERSEKLIGTYLNTQWTRKILSVNQSNH